MPIQPAQLARSLGALGSLDVEQDLAVTLPQVLASAKTLLEADRVGLMLIDQAGALRWATAADGVIEAVAGGDLSVPVRIGSDPVGTLDVYVTAPMEWDDSAAAALQAYAGLVGSLLVAAVTARVTGRLADQLKGALEHRSLIERAVQAIVDRQDRLASAKAQRREATDREVAVHRRNSESHEGEARRYERRGHPGRAQTERLQAAAARPDHREGRACRAVRWTLPPADG